MKVKELLKDYNISEEKVNLDCYKAHSRLFKNRDDNLVAYKITELGILFIIKSLRVTYYFIAFRRELEYSVYKMIIQIPEDKFFSLITDKIIILDKREFDNCKKRLLIGKIK